jgi:hypothetical protein
VPGAIVAVGAREHAADGLGPSRGAGRVGHAVSGQLPEAIFGCPAVAGRVADVRLTAEIS